MGLGLVLSAAKDLICYWFKHVERVKGVKRVKRVKGVKRVLRFALPEGIMVIGVEAVCYWVKRVKSVWGLRLNPGLFGGSGCMGRA